VNLKSRIEKTIVDQSGILFAKPAIVYRNNYSGRSVLANNSSSSSPDSDERGYLPVEWWIMSFTEAQNPEPKPQEGITELILGNGALCSLPDAASSNTEQLFGAGFERWPLIKVLDIGGEAVIPSFSCESEVPPIPPHVHSGRVVNGRILAPGKLEAYFFPPLDVSPYQISMGSVKTRLGLKPGVTKAEFVRAVGEFGRSDAMYALLREYDIQPYDGWTIYPRIIHSPGPWVTLEIQTPQDDYNLAAWRLGVRLDGAECKAEFEDSVLRGLSNADDLLTQAIDWELSARSDFKAQFYRPSKILDQGKWGRVLQIFFDRFYGEAIELAPGHTRIILREDPIAAMIWSGEGFVNGLHVSATERLRREFLIAPGHPAQIVNNGESPLIIFTLFPMLPFC
jgi:hypothetical protein